MRPYFFHKPAVTEARKLRNYQPKHRRGVVPKQASKPGLFKRIVQALKLRNKTVADRAAIAQAEAKRTRRRLRNIRWWANDRTWEFYGGSK